MRKVDGPARSVLVVDDDPDILEAVSLVLESVGIPVEVARDGAAALDRLQAGLRPAVILLDHAMPRMGAPEFRVRQLQDPALAELPVVLMTGDGEAQEKGERLKADLPLRKPVDVDLLLETVGRYVTPGT